MNGDKHYTDGWPIQQGDGTVWDPRSIAIVFNAPWGPLALHVPCPGMLAPKLLPACAFRRI